MPSASNVTLLSPDCQSQRRRRRSESIVECRKLSRGDLRGVQDATVRKSQPGRGSELSESFRCVVAKWDDGDVTVAHRLLGLWEFDRPRRSDVQLGESQRTDAEFVLREVDQQLGRSIMQGVIGTEVRDATLASRMITPASRRGADRDSPDPT